MNNIHHCSRSSFSRFATMTITSLSISSVTSRYWNSTLGHQVVLRNIIAFLIYRTYSCFFQFCPPKLVYVMLTGCVSSAAVVPADDKITENLLRAKGFSNCETTWSIYRHVANVVTTPSTLRMPRRSIELFSRRLTALSMSRAISSVINHR